jgi:hypothetical protein
MNIVDAKNGASARPSGAVPQQPPPDGAYRVLTLARQLRWLAPLRWLKRGAHRTSRSLAGRGRRLCQTLQRAAFRDLYAVVERHSVLLEECDNALEEHGGRQVYVQHSLESRLTALHGLCETLRAEVLLQRQQIDRFLEEAGQKPSQQLPDEQWPTSCLDPGGR